MSGDIPDHYATLGLHMECTADEVRKAYRILAKTHHPDVNQSDSAGAEKIHAITEAYKVLSDQAARRDYDAELEKARRAADLRLQRTTLVDIKEDVFLNFAEFITGTVREITVNDPANPNGPETYELEVPENTAPGAKFRIIREPPFDNGAVIARVKPWPDARFKARGADLKCDLHIHHGIAEDGGAALVGTVLGDEVEVEVPAHCPRGEVIRIEGEGLPKSHGGRGDLLVRVMYRPQVRTRKPSMGGSRPLRRRLR